MGRGFTIIFHSSFYVSHHRKASLSLPTSAIESAPKHSCFTNSGIVPNKCLYWDVEKYWTNDAQTNIGPMPDKYWTKLCESSWFFLKFGSSRWFTYKLCAGSRKQIRQLLGILEVQQLTFNPLLECRYSDSSRLWILKARVSQLSNYNATHFSGLEKTKTQKTQKNIKDTIIPPVNYEQTISNRGKPIRRKRKV